MNSTNGDQNISNGNSSGSNVTNNMNKNRRNETKDNRPTAKAKTNNMVEANYIAPVCVKMSTEQRLSFKTPDLLDKVKASKISEHILRAKFDKNRDVLLYPKTLSSITFLMDEDTDLFSKTKRSNIGSKENFPLMISNISLDEYNQNSDVKNFFIAQGFNDPKSVTSSAAKLTKIFCSTAISRINILKQQEFEIKFANEKRFIKIEPCIQIKQCYSCNKFGHIENDPICNNKISNTTNCSNCNEATHILRNCKVSNESIICTNCGKNHNAYDRINCPTYIKLKEESIKTERTKILKIPDADALKQTWSEIASIKSNKDEDRTYLKKELGAQDSKLSENIALLTANNELLRQSLNSQVTEVKLFAENEAIKVYVKSNNETNEKLDKIENQIAFLYEKLLPNQPFVRLTFPKLRVSVCDPEMDHQDSSQLTQK
jgi:hypothetical protein